MQRPGDFSGASQAQPQQAQQHAEAPQSQYGGLPLARPFLLPVRPTQTQQALPQRQDKSAAQVVPTHHAIPLREYGNPYLAKSQSQGQDSNSIEFLRQTPYQLHFQNQSQYQSPRQNQHQHQTQPMPSVSTAPSSLTDLSPVQLLALFIGPGAYGVEDVKDVEDIALYVQLRGTIAGMDDVERASNARAAAERFLWFDGVCYEKPQW